MTADQIVASLRAKSPGALAELLDSYGDQLFQYCWCMLGSRDIAQIALRDTLVVADAICLAVPTMGRAFRRSCEPYSQAISSWRFAPIK